MQETGESNLETRVLACEHCFTVDHCQSGKTSQAVQCEQRIPYCLPYHLEFLEGEVSHSNTTSRLLGFSVPVSSFN